MLMINCKNTGLTQIAQQFESNQCLALAYCYFHVPKLARSTEAMSFLPEVADDLVAQRRCAVSEGTVVSLQN